jgi:hypothetical protein
MRAQALLPATGLLLVTSTGAVLAQDKSQYSLFNPTPAAEVRAFSTDRPTKSTLPFTVDAGHAQYEGDLAIYSFNNTSTPDTSVTSWTIGNPTFKLGLTNYADVEVNVSAYNSIRTVTRSTGATSIAQGLGDTFTRLKLNLFGNDGGKAAMAVVPYAKWPTAPLGVGNGVVEGGLMAPLALSLPNQFTLVLMAEVDYQKNPNDNGYHAGLPALINVSRQVASNLTAYAELYADWSTTPQVKNIYTADFALAWTPMQNFQIDAGINVGLVAAAIPYQIYVGVSQRF